MLLTRYGHQRKLNSPTVRRRQFLLGCSVPTIDAHRPDVHERDDVFPPTHRESEPGLALAGTGMSRSPGCLCVV